MPSWGRTVCARRFAVNLVTASIANLAISKLLMVHCQFPIQSTPTSYLLTSSFPFVSPRWCGRICYERNIPLCP